MIIKVTNENKNYLESFLCNKIPNTFRYFKTRNVDIIKNHILTVLYIKDEVPIAYGHIDAENNINWLGICVLEEYQGQGIGKKVLNFLLDYAKENSINLQLSVDKNNEIAINLYLKNNFKVIGETNNYFVMKL